MKAAKRTLNPMRVGVLLSMMLVTFGLTALTAAPARSPAQALALAPFAQTAVGDFNVYFTESSGEAGRFDRGDGGASQLAGVLRELGATLYTLDWRTTFPTNIDLIVVLGPTGDFSADQQARLWAYVSGGGRVMMAINPTVQRSRSDRGSFDANLPLFSLTFTDFGLRPVNDVAVIEGELRTIRINDENQLEDFTEAGVITDGVVGDTLELPVLENFLITGNYDAAHPITAGLTEEMLFFGARSVVADVGTSGASTPLVFSPDTYYGESRYSAYLASGLVNYDIGADTDRGAMALAAAYESADPAGGRIVLIGDREVVTNGGGFNTSPPGSTAFLFPGNVRFTVNAVAWLLGIEPPQITFAAPAATYTATITPSPMPTQTPEPEVTAEATAEATAAPASGG